MTWACSEPLSVQPPGERLGEAPPAGAITIDAEIGGQPIQPSQPEAVLVNQDLHALNVVSAEREPWLVIDPKPLIGERAFGIAALVRGGELGHGRAQVLRRLDRLTADLGINRDRARGWCLAQTLAWGLDESGSEQAHVEVARWLSDT